MVLVVPWKFVRYKVVVLALLLGFVGYNGVLLEPVWGSVVCQRVVLCLCGAAAMRANLTLWYAVRGAVCSHSLCGRCLD